jgi:hypothetical protein
MIIERFLPSMEGATVLEEVSIPRTNLEYEVKSYVLVNLDGKEFNLFSRKVELFCLPTLIGFDDSKKITFSETYFLAWSLLKERGLPVVPEVWKVGSDKVFTTNLIAERGSVYDQKIDSVIERDTLPMDSQFVKIPKVEIESEADRLLELANKNGIELMSDGPFHIKVNPDGSFNIFVLDIGKVRIYSMPKDLPREVKDNNYYYISKALREFTYINGNIKVLRDARGLS